MVEMIEERKFSEDKEQKRDLLSSLVNANEEFLDDGKQLLLEEELIGKRSPLDQAVPSSGI